MKRINDCLKDWYANARKRPGAVNPVPRWRGVFMALVLALFVGSAGQPLQVRAAPTSAKSAYFVFATNQGRDNATICVGDNLLISVNVVRTSIDNDIQTNRLNVSGIWVAGSVQGPSLGKFIIARKQTGFNYQQPGIADFIFHADKPGKTTLSFNAEIHYWKYTVTKWLFGPAKTAVSNLVGVTVEDCKFKVTAISHWNGFGLNLVAVIDQAALTADTPGHYTGKATVNWVISEAHPRAGCSPHEVTSTSQADLTGVMDENSQLWVDLAYQLGEVSWFTYLDDCTTQSSSQLISHTPARLTLSIPASGEVSRQSQALVDQFPAMNMSGSADVFVTRETKP